MKPMSSIFCIFKIEKPSEIMLKGSLFFPRNLNPLLVNLNGVIQLVLFKFYLRFSILEFSFYFFQNPKLLDCVFFAAF